MIKVLKVYKTKRGIAGLELVCFKVFVGFL